MDAPLGELVHAAMPTLCIRLPQLYQAQFIVPPPSDQIAFIAPGEGLDVVRV